MPVIHIARNRVDLVCTRITLTEKRPDVARCNCSREHDTQHIRGLAQSEDSDLTEVHSARSDASYEVLGNSGRVLSVSCGLTAHVQCGTVCITHRSQNPRNAKSTVTDHDNRSLPASVMSGHNSRSLHAVRNYGNRSLPAVRDLSNRSLPASTLSGHNSRTLPESTMKDHNIESLVEPGEESATQMTKLEETDTVDCLCGDDNQFSVLASQEADPETVCQDSQAEVTGPSQDVIDRLTCAVCLCFFYEPHYCQPCGHVFCSSCLRRLCAASMIDTRCPLCRSIIQHCFVHPKIDEDIKRLFPDEVSSRRKSERKSRIGQFPLPGGQRGIVQFLRGRRYAPGQRSSHYFITSVCLVLLLLMITFTILATTVGVIVIYLVELFVDVGVELFDDVNWFVNYAMQMLIVFCIEGRIPQELSKLWLGRVCRIIDDIARIANRTMHTGGNDTSGDELDVIGHRGVHTSYYTQYMLSKMAQANAANVILLSCLGIFLVYKLLQHRRLIR